MSAANLLLIGPPGVGKTMLAVAIGRRAVEAGYRVYYATAADLVAKTQRAALEGRWLTTMRFWNGPQPLICDELGYLPLPAEAASHFFQVVSRRYHHGSIILTTNRGIAQWGEIFDDPTVAPPPSSTGSSTAASSSRATAPPTGCAATKNDSTPSAPASKPPSRQVEGRADHSQAAERLLSASIRIDCGRKRPDRPRRRQTHRPKPSPLKARKRAVGLLV